MRNTKTTKLMDKDEKIAAPDADTEKPFIRALARGLDVISAMTDARAGLSLSEVASRVELDRATARRILMTFEALGYVRSADRRFHLTPKILTLGYAYLSSTPVLDLAKPYLSQAAADVGGSCSICVIDGDQLMYLARASAVRRNLSQLVEIGTHLPLYATSAGKILLASIGEEALEAYLGRVKLVPFTSRTITDVDVLRDAIYVAGRNGWAASDQEQEDGVRSVAIPLRNGAGAVVAALNASVQASVLIREDIESQQSMQLKILETARTFIEPALAGEMRL